MVMALDCVSEGRGFKLWQEPPDNLRPQIAAKDLTNIPTQIKLRLLWLTSKGLLYKFLFEKYN